MKPINKAWAFLKALPEDEITQNRWRFARGKTHPFLDAQGTPTGGVVRDLTEQLRLQTRHPALKPSRHIESVNERLTNRTDVAGLSPQTASEILRYPDGWNITGQEKGRADHERMLQARENRNWQDRISLPHPHEGMGARVLKPRFGYFASPYRVLTEQRTAMPELSDEEMANLRQQAEQMPFSYESN